MDKKSEAIRSVFTVLVTLLESQHQRLDELGRIVFSLQGTVRGLDPTFEDVNRKMAEEIDSAVAPLAQQTSEQFAQLQQLIASLDLG